MKILQIISSVGLEGGGPIEGLMQQGEQLTALGCTVDTASLDGPDVQISPRLNRRTVFLLGPGLKGYGYTPRLEPWLREHARDYDCIVVHGMWQFHGYCTAKVCRDVGVPYVMFLHGMLDPWFNRQYPLKKLKKWLYWPWGEYRVLRDARFVLFTTEEERRLARQSFWLYKARERWVGYGIGAREIPQGEAKEDFLSAFPALRGKRLFLYLSRIHPKKGCDLLIEAFAKVAKKHPDLHLVLAGPDGVGWKARLEAQASAAGLEGRITFPGMLTGRLKWGAYDAAEVFTLPSHQENFGIVVAEALASGLPVLTTYQVNIWREIESDRAGIITRDDLSGTEESLARWIGMDAAAKQAMRQNAVECFNKNFEIGKVVRNLHDAIREATTTPAGQHNFVGTFKGTADA